MADEIHVHQQPSQPPQPPQQPAGNGGGGSAGWVVAGLIVIVLAVVLWFVFARNGGNDGVPNEINIDVNLPTQTGN